MSKSATSAPSTVTHYCLGGGGLKSGTHDECSACAKVLAGRDDLAPPRTPLDYVARKRWPGRRERDAYPWAALIVAALLACAVGAVPDSWRLAAPAAHCPATGTERR